MIMAALMHGYATGIELVGWWSFIISLAAVNAWLMHRNRHRALVARIARLNEQQQPVPYRYEDDEDDEDD
jgi:hypothetical protein